MAEVLLHEGSTSVLLTEVAHDKAAMEPTTTKARREAPPYGPQINHPNHFHPQDICMLEPSHSPPRKRARSEQHTRQHSGEAPPVKRRKSNHYPAAFWDSLSKIHLEKAALRELDKRNIRNPSRSPRIHHAHLRSDSFKDLKAFSRHGGPYLLDLRGFPEPSRPLIRSSDHTMSSSRSNPQRDAASASSGPTPTTNPNKTKTTGPYNRNFEQELIDHNVYPVDYTHPGGSVAPEPTNWKDINDMLRQPRPSLSPSKFSIEDHRKFKSANRDAKREKQVSELVIPVLEGRINDARCRSGGTPFTNLEPLADVPLTTGNPDVYYGARPEQLSRQVRTKLSKQIIPSTQHDLPITPNFLLAVKGRGGSEEVAERQACYDGALCARGIASLEEYVQGEPRYGTAHTISTTYKNGHLQMFTSHVAQPSSTGGRPEYHMTQVNAWGISGNVDTFREGATAYRNARDWAQKQRDDLIRQANEKEALGETQAPAPDEAGASPTLSFVTAASDTEEYTTTTNEGSNLSSVVVESNSSMETFVDTTVAASQSHKRKRRSTNAESQA